MRTTVVSLTIVLLCLVSFVQPAQAVAYRLPVEGVVIDPFRPPISPYGPGNRGWEFSVKPGAEVVAPATGVVTFAGQVGGKLNVVIQHDDGVRTTISKLRSIDE